MFENNLHTALIRFDAKFFFVFFRFENRKGGITSSSCLDAHAGFFRLSMKEKFTVTFLEKVVFHIINTHY